MKRSVPKLFIHLSLTIFLFHSLIPDVFSQDKMDRIAKEQVMSILSNVKNTLKKEYYDPTFGGVDIDAKFKIAEEKLKTTETLSQAFAVIAQVVVDLNDSHTRFYPPKLAAIVEYGWRIKMYGSKAFIVAVKAKSDAEKKGLKVGDEVLRINGFPPKRSELWKMIYYYETISPRAKMTLEVKDPEGVIRQLDIDTKITTLRKTIDLTNHMDINEAYREGDKYKDVDKHYFKEVGNALVWKLPTFSFDPLDVDGLISRAHKKETLIIDLRGNSGGYVVTLEKLAGYFFNEDLKIADLKGRKPMEPQQAKTQGSKVFPGKLIVLIDSGSASASEIFARLVQFHMRGIILGDVSAGAVMQSIHVYLDAGQSTEISYGMNMTNADVIMSDGKSLERRGVIPDEKILPTGKDLAERNDPVLARALEMSGNPVDAAVAGKFFPPEPFINRTSNVAFVPGN